jgi:hypothetical protein
MESQKSLESCTLDRNLSRATVVVKQSTFYLMAFYLSSSNRNKIAFSYDFHFFKDSFKTLFTVIQACK